MRKYELMTVFTVNEEESKTGLEKVKSLLGDFGAKIESEEPRGDRTLAYEIRKQKKGRYVLFVIEADPDKVAELNRQIKLIPSILTFMFVKVEE